MCKFCTSCRLDCQTALDCPAVAVAFAKRISISTIGKRSVPGIEPTYSHRRELGTTSAQERARYLFKRRYYTDQEFNSRQKAKAKAHYQKRKQQCPEADQKKQPS